MRNKTSTALLTAILASAPAFAADQPTTTSAQAALDFESPNVKLGYAMGFTAGRHYRFEKAKLSLEAVYDGLIDGYQNHIPKISPVKQRTIISKFYQSMEKTVHEKFDKAAENAKKSGEAFLEENGKKPGITTTASGLQYQVLTQGDGPKPDIKATVKVDYEGALTNGHVFDSSFKRGQAATFPLGHVIPGWIEGLQRMPTGSTWMFYIPADLAYGTRGVPGQIPPNAVLVFKVHLIDIVK